MKAITDIQIPDVPWYRLTTAYGRGTDIPLFIKEKQYASLAGLIEHQGTLWQVTPWTILVLMEKLRTVEPVQVSIEEIDLYLAVASALANQDIRDVGLISSMDELLDDKYLWPEKEDGDEEEWEEEEPRGYEPDPFYGYYYFSGVLLKQDEAEFTRIMNGNEDLAPRIRELLALLKHITAE